MSTVKRFVIVFRTNLPLDVIAAAVAPALEAAFRERDSSFYGGQYFLAGEAMKEEIRIYRNYDPGEDSPIYQDAPDWPVVMDFSRTCRDSSDMARRIQEMLAVEYRIIRGHERLGEG